MTTVSEGSYSFCTPGSMMTAHAYTMNMPVTIPNNNKQLSNNTNGLVSDDAHEHNTTDDNDNNTSQDSSHDFHNQSSDMNHEDHHHSSMNHHDHSSHHNMPMMSQGTVMYMDGFHSALFHNSETPPPCLNFLHPSWTLHTPPKFLFAMLSVTLMGMMVEACGIWRVRCLRKGRAYRREYRIKRIQQWQQRQSPNLQGRELEYRSNQMFQRDVSEISDASNHENGEEDIAHNMRQMMDDDCPRIIRKIWRIIPSCIRQICEKRFTGLDKRGSPKWIQIYDVGAASLHALRAWFGYLLMLAVMTYAVEFMFSAIAGMVFGRYYFVDMGEGGNGGGVMGGAVGVGGGIGGAGLGEGGGGGNDHDQGVAMNTNNVHDGTWGGGGDPCCGIDEHDDDDDHMNGESLQVPLLGSTNSAGVKRRNAFDP